ncbi:SGNH/GDSL hydrolase family protein [Pedobacter sp. MC2016-15]|uniref:SGNH/GDSL hydrolase family protein n=1 Tax=Pedobacter sp. MC2016-15 TaxID=2994473 RepID=UPI002246510E|nr:SGNH/GDSL hydrolase family protein [Pedobacter sp. MC2016-15]MCX2478735.1 SGNH/GDSL hydrolase family protein [Pedobacter sp. MC2016-15]
MKITAAFLLLLSLMACEKSSTNGMSKTDTTKTTIPAAAQSYLALGDSYTIGEAVAQSSSFPYQLAAALKSQGIDLGRPKIIARTGWTTDELQDAIKAEALSSKFDVVTLLIGVNNQYRGNSIDTYRKEFVALLQQAITFAGGNKSHVFVVSIPDWGATPFGKQSGRGVQNIAREIDAFNAVNKEETLKAGLSYTDITSGSRNAATDNSLVASDGLHPSALMYKDWVTLLAPAVSKALTLR